MVEQATIIGELVLQPPTSVLRIVVAGAALAVLGASVYWRNATISRRVRWGLGALRILTIGGLAVILLGPSALRHVTEEFFRRKLVIAMDTSCSMAVRDAAPPATGTRPASPGGTAESRFEAARRAWLDPKLLNRLREKYDVRFYRYDEKLAATGPGPMWELPAPGGRQTYITAAVLRLLETEFTGGRPAGLVLIGDGHETGQGDPDATGAAAAQRGVPVYTSCFGAVRDTRDVAVQTFAGQEFLFAKQDGQISARIVQSGYGMAEANVTLLREGQPIQQRHATFRSRAGADVLFDIREDVPGLYAYEVRVDPLPGETETANNSRFVFARVSNEKIKVLLVEGQPYWDTKFLAQSLRADNQIELTQLVRYAPWRFHAIRGGTREASGADAAKDASIPIPRTKSELFAYDILIFGKGLTEFLNVEQLPLLKAYLDERGGGIVFARGRAYDPSTRDGAAAARALAALEPAEWGDEFIRQLKMELTPEGREHPSFQFRSEKPSDVIVQELPGMIGAVKILREKAAALVLARSHEPPEFGSDENVAAVAYQNYGKGKVVAILNEGLWRWALLPPRQGTLAELAPFDMFWRRMLRWIVGSAEFLPGQDVALSVVQFPENLGDTAKVEVRLKHPPTAETKATLTTIGPDGREQSLEIDRSHEPAGLLRSTFEPTQPGIHIVRLRTPDLVPPQQETRFCVYDYSLELIQTSADPTTMQDIAEKSGGATIDPADPEKLLSLLDAARPHAQAKRELTFVWDQPWVFGTILTVLSLEWFLRRRSGVP